MVWSVPTQNPILICCQSPLLIHNCEVKAFQSCLRTVGGLHWHPHANRNRSICWLGGWRGGEWQLLACQGKLSENKHTRNLHLSQYADLVVECPWCEGEREGEVIHGGWGGGGSKARETPGDRVKESDRSERWERQSGTVTESTTGLERVCLWGRLASGPVNLQQRD